MPSIQTLNVSHHLTDETVQEYSAGALSLPMETLVACHLTVCEHCRTRTERADQIGGFMVSASESVQVSTSAADLLQRSRTENATYVVRGSYHDEIGQFKTGDIADLDGHHSHKPVIDSAEPCIALIATHSPVRYSGVFSRLMQPFVGI